MTWPRGTHVELPWTVSPDVTMSARARARIPAAGRPSGDDWHALVTRRAGTPDAPLADALLAQPIMDVDYAAEAAGCSATAARRSLERLETAGIVIGYQAGKRRRAWRAPVVLDLMDRVANGLGRRDVPG